MVEVVIITECTTMIEWRATLHVVSRATSRMRSFPMTAGNDIMVLILVTRAFGSRRPNGRFAAVLTVDSAARWVVTLIVADIATLFLLPTVVLFLLEVIPTAVAGDDCIRSSIRRVAVVVGWIGTPIWELPVVFLVALVRLFTVFFVLIFFVLFPRLVLLPGFGLGMLIVREWMTIVREWIVDMVVLGRESVGMTILCHERILRMHARLSLAMRHELIMWW
jgi:hypothetical protein